MERMIGKSEYKAMSMTAAVLGGGAWGTALACVEASGFARVNLFTLETAAAEEITRFRRNSRYLDDAPVPWRVFATTSLERALAGVDCVIVAVPSHASREVARRTLELIGHQVPVILATKGMEHGTGLLSLEVWRREIAALGGNHRSRHRDPLVLSGPNLAREIARGMPAVSCLAGTDAARVRSAIELLEREGFTLVACGDPLGVQAAGALKNVYAIGCGLGKALGWGDNVMAAMVWRGLEETGRFAGALGGEPSTVTTPAGVGDFLATCTSPLSRNHDLGRALGGLRGQDEGVRGVREGARTAGEALRRARGLRVDMPLLEAVSSVLDGVRKPEAVLAAACGAPGSRRMPTSRGGRLVAQAATASLLSMGTALGEIGVAGE